MVGYRDYDTYALNKRAHVTAALFAYVSLDVYVFVQSLYVAFLMSVPDTAATTAFLVIDSDVSGQTRDKSQLVAVVVHPILAIVSDQKTEP